MVRLATPAPVRGASSQTLDGLCASPQGYWAVMTEEAIDPTGERMKDPEGPDTPNHKLPPPLEETKDPEPRPAEVREPTKS